jgi:hypothetical protein
MPSTKQPSGLKVFLIGASGGVGQTRLYEVKGEGHDFVRSWGSG